MKCDICKTNELEDYCTANVCRECCITMKCPIRFRCLAYGSVMEKSLKRALEDTYQNEIIDTDMVHEEIGPHKTYPNKQDWAESKLLEWSEEKE